LTYKVDNFRPAVFETMI